MLSNNIIEIVKLSTTEKGLKMVVQHSPNHGTYKIKMRKFLKLKMTRWEFNRPANMERAEEIAKSLLHKTHPISYLIHCVYTSSQNLGIVDGIHRYYAIKILEEQLEDIESNSWFYNSYLLIELKINSTSGEIIDWFQSINNCVPVSELYLNSNDEKKEIVEEVVNTYYARYTSHFKGSNPNIPNTSKERFTELVSYIYEKFNVSFENKRMIMRVLEDINDNIQKIVLNNNPKRLNNKITDKSLEKCKKSGLYLFLIPKEQLYKLILEYKL